MPTCPAHAEDPAPAAGPAAAAVLRAVLDAADSLLIVVLDESMQIRHTSTGVVALLGWTPAQIDGQPYSLLFTGEDGNGHALTGDVGAPCTSAPPTHAPQLTGRARLRTRDGFTRSVRLTSTTVLDEAGAPAGTVVVAVEAAIKVERGGTTAPGAVMSSRAQTSPDDVTEHPTLTPDHVVADSVVRRRLADSQEQFRLTFDRSPTAMAIISLSPATLGRVRRVNTAFEVFTGRGRSQLSTTSLRELLHHEEVPGHLAYLQLAAQTGRCEPDGVERRFVHADGRVRWARKTTAVVTPSNSPEPYLLVQLHDTTAQRAATEALAHAALHDPLTGLANRALFTDHLELALSADRRHRRGVGLLYLDLDSFKPVNDRYGHAAGDAVLIEVADRLREVMRGEETVARLGGDEFAVICPGLDVEHLPVVLARVRRALRAPVQLPASSSSAGSDGPPGEVLVEVGVSIGTALSSHHIDTGPAGGGDPGGPSGQSAGGGVLSAPTAQQMLVAADQSMYAAKLARTRSTHRRRPR